MKMDSQTVRDIIAEKPGVKFKLDGKPVRLFINNGRVCKFAKRSTRRGWLMDDAELARLQVVDKEIDPAERWAKAWGKVEERLAASGWWPNYREEVRTALAVGYEKVQAARAIDRSHDAGLTYDENKKQQLAKIKEIDARLVVIGKDGEERLNTGVMWYMYGMPRVKKMRFNRYLNDEILERLAEEIAKCVPGGPRVHEYGRTSYDVSFEFRIEEDGTKRGWYSEEFKGCGNGHYYLALDATHAVHYEDD